MDSIEQWLAQYPATLSALTTLATLAATIVALVAARHARVLARPSVEVLVGTAEYRNVGERTSVVRSPKAAGGHIAVFFKNRSAFPVHVDQHCFWVRVPLAESAINIHPGEPFSSQDARVLAPFTDTAIMWSDTDGFARALANSLSDIPAHRRLLWWFSVDLKGGAKIKLTITPGIRALVNQRLRILRTPKTAQPSAS